MSVTNIFFKFIVFGRTIKNTQYIRLRQLEQTYSLWDWDTSKLDKQQIDSYALAVLRNQEPYAKALNSYKITISNISYNQFNNDINVIVLLTPNFDNIVSASHQTVMDEIRKYSPYVFYYDKVNYSDNVAKVYGENFIPYTWFYRIQKDITGLNTLSYEIFLNEDRQQFTFSPVKIDPVKLNPLIISQHSTIVPTRSKSIYSKLTFVLDHHFINYSGDRTLINQKVDVPINESLYSSHVLTNAIQSMPNVKHNPNRLYNTNLIWYDDDSQTIKVNLTQYNTINKISLIKKENLNLSGTADFRPEDISNRFYYLLRDKIALNKRNSLALISKWMEQGFIDPQGYSQKKIRTVWPRLIYNLFYDHNLKAYDFSWYNAKSLWTIRAKDIDNSYPIQFLMSGVELAILPFQTAIFDLMKTGNNPDTYEDDLKSGVKALKNKYKENILINLFNFSEEWLDQDLNPNYIEIGILRDGTTMSLLLPKPFAIPKFPSAAIENKSDYKYSSKYGIFYSKYFTDHNIVFSLYNAGVPNKDGTKVAVANQVSVKKSIDFYEGILINVYKSGFILSELEKRQSLSDVNKGSSAGWLISDVSFTFFDNLILRNTVIQRIVDGHNQISDGFNNRIELQTSLPVSTNSNLFAKFVNISSDASLVHSSAEAIYDLVGARPLASRFGPLDSKFGGYFSQRLSMGYRKTIDAYLDKSIFEINENDSLKMKNIKESGKFVSIMLNDMGCTSQLDFMYMLHTVGIGYEQFYFNIFDISHKIATPLFFTNLGLRFEREMTWNPHCAQGLYAYFAVNDNVILSKSLFSNSTWVVEIDGIQELFKDAVKRGLTQDLPMGTTEFVKLYGAEHGII